MAQVIPMMEGRNFTALNEGNEYDMANNNSNSMTHPMHDQGDQQQVHLVASSQGGVPPEYSYGAATTGFGAHPQYGHPYAAAQIGDPYATRQQGVADDQDAAPNGVEEELEETAQEIDPKRLAQPLKLFVGQVPKIMSEDELVLVFEPYGRILDLTVIRDRRTGSHRGCAFVTYENGEDAMKVVAEMHGKYKFEGGSWPAQVRPAAGEIDDAGSDSKEAAEGT